ncbi:MAG: hypothetical protein D3906_12265, partial [Candidatus Electrothrix sp. AUS1_2]|nr:hypothetical protein [Candidatus Electrothrix sp. AUS1_2]
VWLVGEVGRIAQQGNTDMGGIGKGEAEFCGHDGSSARRRLVYVREKIIDSKPYSVYCSWYN